ncbi:MAG: AsmA-like C-terminal region-containing protein [Pseudomonadota bacterium]
MTVIFRINAILRKLVKWFYICFAVAVIGLAMLVQAGRSFSHLVAEYPQQISHYLSNQFKANVSIGSLKAEWDGLKPILDVGQLQITSQTGQPIISLAQAHLQLNLLDSLLHVRLVWSALTLQQVKIEFVQSANGQWYIPGLPRDVDEKPEEPARLDPLLDMLLLSRHIEFQQTHFNFQFASGAKTLLQSPSVRIDNGSGFHRLSMQVDIDNHPKTLQLIVEAKGDPRHKGHFKTNAFLQLNNFPTNEPIAAATAFLLHGIKAEVHSTGTLNAKVWLKSNPKRPGFDVVGNIGVQRLNVPILGRDLALDSFSADVAGGWFYDGKWQLALQNIGANINQIQIEKANVAASASGLDAPVMLHLQSLNLETLSHALDGAGVLGEARLRDVIRQLAPRGELRNIEVSIPLQKPSDWQLQSNLIQVATNAWQGVPALTKVDGFVQAGQRGGYVNIDSQHGFSMFYHPTYTAPMEFERARGQVAWWLQPEKNQIYVNSGLLEFVNGEEKAKGYMWLALPWKPGSGDVDLYLQIGARQLNASLYRKFTPAVVPRSLLEWLDNSIGAQNTGMAKEGGFVYRGTLNTPKRAARSHQLYLDVNQGQLRFHPEWPALAGINGRLLVDEENITASVDAAKLFSSDVGATQISVRPNPQGDGTLLRVKGLVTGVASDGLRVLRESMLRQYIGANMDSWKLEGEMRTQVNIAVPLARDEPGNAQQIDIDLQSPYFELGNLKLSMRNITGHISYNQDGGISSQNLQGKLFGEPIAVQLSTLKHSDFSQTLVDVKGEVDSQALAKWSQRPEALYLEGKIPYQAHVELNHRAKPNTVNVPGVKKNIATALEVKHPFAVVTVSSQLNNVAVNLPAPYGKTRDSERPLIFEMSMFENSSLIDVSYNDNLQALLELEPHNNNKLHNANIALGGSAKLADKPQFLLSGKLPELDIEPWQKVYEQYLSYSSQLEQGNHSAQAKQAVETPADALVAGLPFHAAVALDHYQVGPILFRDIDVKAERLTDAWKVQFVNAIASGGLYLPNDKQKPIRINLENLHIPNNMIDGKTKTLNADALNANEPSVIDNKKQGVTIDPRSLPLADITVRELYVESNNYGSWALQIRPNDQGVLFDNIQGKVRGITITGVEDVLSDANSITKSGAKLSWTHKASGPYTHFTGALSATDISSVLQQWQKPDMIESTNARVTADVGWMGDPQDFNLKKLSGNMNVWMEKGRFKRTPSVGSDGFLRLMAILNFDSLARRLRLDFSDLYQSGLAYDEINGKVDFEPGTMIFAEPLVVKTPSSRLQLAGKLDLEHEKINARLVATLPIAGNFTFFTALVTGLPAAAGIYVISKLFKKQVDQATSVSYSIRGGWDDPKMTFDRLFESEESLRNSVSRNEFESPGKIKRRIKTNSTKTNATKSKSMKADSDKTILDKTILDKTILDKTILDKISPEEKTIPSN